MTEIVSRRRSAAARAGKGLLIFLFMLALLAGGGIYGVRKWQDSRRNDGIQVVTYTVQRDRFVHCLCRVRLGNGDPHGETARFGTA